MGLVAASFGIAATAVVAASLPLGRRHPAFRVSVMLLAFWAVANLTPAWSDILMDLAGFYVIALFYLYAPRAWLAAIGGCFLIQLVSHVIFPDPASRDRMLVLNIIFGLELACAAFGTLHGLQDLVMGRPVRLHPRRSRLPARASGRGKEATPAS